jgi:hypothetical protein
MEPLNTLPVRDPIGDRIDTINMSASEREQAKVMMRRAESFADLLVELTAAGRGLAAHPRGAFRRHFGARYQNVSRPDTTRAC